MDDLNDECNNGNSVCKTYMFTFWCTKFYEIKTFVDKRFFATKNIIVAANYIQKKNYNIGSEIIY